MRNVKGQFEAGKPSEFRDQVGDIRIRTRYKRGGEQRAFIKIAEPNKWKLLAQFNWEQANGPIPKGLGVHHKDENKLNDSLDNLELVTKAEHLEIHRSGFDREKRIGNFIKARRLLQWSTKSETKRVGRHPKDCQCPIHKK